GAASHHVVIAVVLPFIHRKGCEQVSVWFHRLTNGFRFPALYMMGPTLRYRDEQPTTRAAISRISSFIHGSVDGCKTPQVHCIAVSSTCAHGEQMPRL